MASRERDQDLCAERGPNPVLTAEARVRELEAALFPFAAYAHAMNAYALLHAGDTPPDHKTMAYVETETGRTGVIKWGDLRLAAQLMPGARHEGETAAMRIARARRAGVGQGPTSTTEASQGPGTSTPTQPPKEG